MHPLLSAYAELPSQALFVTAGILYVLMGKHALLAYLNILTALGDRRNEL
jgi:hypothetical protein